MSHSRAKSLSQTIESFLRRFEDEVTVKEMLDTENAEIEDNGDHLSITIPMTDKNWSVSNVNDLADYFNSVGFHNTHVINNGMEITMNIPKDNEELISRVREELGISL